MTRVSRRGFALPILLFALFGAAIVWALYAVRLVGSFDQRAKIQTETALRVARDALIQYAAQASTPGSLPCPDTSSPNNGIAGDNNNSCVAGAIGRFPWKTLGIDPPQDGSGECLWYALAGGARAFLSVETRGSGGTQPALNPSWSGSVVLHDDASGSNTAVMAVLIAPGAPQKGQIRTPGGRCNNGTAANFLEALDGYDNASGTSAVSATERVGFNDTVLAVTAQNVYAAVAPRVLLELAGTDDTSGLRKLLGAPPAAGFGNPGGPLVLDFTDPTVFNAFPRPAFPPAWVGAEPLSAKLTVLLSWPVTYALAMNNGCVDYVTSTSSQTDGKITTVSASGTFSVEWLCFNQWLPYTQFSPADPTRITLGVPALGWQAIWQANVLPAARTQLHRIPAG